MGKFDLEEILKNNFSLLERDESSSLKRIRLWIFHRWYLKGSKDCRMFFSFLVFIDDLSFQRLFFFFFTYTERIERIRKCTRATLRAINRSTTFSRQSKHSRQTESKSSSCLSRGQKRVKRPTSLIQIETFIYGGWDVS